MKPTMKLTIDKALTALNMTPEFFHPFCRACGRQAYSVRFSKDEATRSITIEAFCHGRMEKMRIHEEWLSVSGITLRDVIDRMEFFKGDERYLADSYPKVEAAMESYQKRFPETAIGDAAEPLQASPSPDELNEWAGSIAIVEAATPFMDRINRIPGNPEYRQQYQETYEAYRRKVMIERDREALSRKYEQFRYTSSSSSFPVLSSPPPPPKKPKPAPVVKLDHERSIALE